MKEQKQVIPFKYYSSFILISILLIITISAVVYVSFTKDNKYDFPFIKIMDQDKEVVRIYPASSFDHIVIDEKPLTYHIAEDFINKTISYQDLSDYNFGEIDHYVASDIYKVYDNYSVNYLTLYEKDKKITGITYKYMVNKTGTIEFPEREYVYQDVLRIEKIIGDNFTVETNINSKNFVVNRDGMIYVLTVIANDLTENTIGKILGANKQISINISVFNSVGSYNDLKLQVQN